MVLILKQLMLEPLELSSELACGDVDVESLKWAPDIPKVRWLRGTGSSSVRNTITSLFLVAKFRKKCDCHLGTNT